MPQTPESELVYVAGKLAAYAIERYTVTEPAAEAALRQYAKNWWPDADEFTLREIVGKLRVHLEYLRNLLGDRTERQASVGTASVPT